MPAQGQGQGLGFTGQKSLAPPVPPIPGSDRITEDGSNIRVTESGNTRVTESPI